LGFLSLFSPKELLIGLPVFLQNLFLSEHLIRVEVPRYTMPLIPFIFISAIHSFANLSKKNNLKRKYVCVVSIIIFWSISTYKFVWDSTYNPRFLQVLSPVPQEVRIHREAINKIAKLIPPSASVCADLKGFPFLANRFKLYDIPFHIHETEYILIDKKEPTFSPKPIISLKECLEITNGVLKSSDYEIVKEIDNVILLKRKKKP